MGWSTHSPLDVAGKEEPAEPGDPEFQTCGLHLRSRAGNPLDILLGSVNIIRKAKDARHKFIGRSCAVG